MAVPYRPLHSFIKCLINLINMEADDDAALSVEDRQRHAAEVATDLLAVERDEIFLYGERRPTGFRSNTVPMLIRSRCLILRSLLRRVPLHPAQPGDTLTTLSGDEHEPRRAVLCCPRGVWGGAPAQADAPPAALAPIFLALAAHRIARRVFGFEPRL